jgi:MYXO-CTERM domain-containing protein
LLTVVLLIVFMSAPRAARADGAFPDSDSVLVPAALPSTIVLGTNFGVVTSVDDGQTWTWSCEQPNSAYASHYQMGPPAANRLYATALVAATASLVFSGDGACSWQVAGGAIAGTTVSDAFPDPTNAARVLVLVSRATDAGSIAEAWESADGGATFGVRRYAAANGDQLTGIESAASDPSTVYLSLLAHGEGGLRPQLARSIDGGASWTVQDLGAALGSVVNLRIIAVAPDDAERVFLRVSLGSAGEAVAVTTDGGATLTSPLTIAGGVVSAFARVPSSGDLIVGGDVGTPVAFRSTDGGATFQPLPAPPHLRGLAARGARLYAAADNDADGYAVGISDDEGETWQPLVSYAPGGTSIAPHAIGAIAACVAGACRSDCLSRASMSQWAPDLCTAAPAEPGQDAGAARDAGTDARSPAKDAAADRPNPRASNGCGCQTGGPPGQGSLVALTSLAILVRRRGRR